MCLFDMTFWQTSDGILDDISLKLEQEKSLLDITFKTHLNEN